MKLLHQLGHNYKWALDSYFINEIGDGFILSPYNISSDKIGKKLSGYSFSDLKPNLLMDLQFYGSNKTKAKKPKTYDFHPVNYETDYVTNVDGMSLVEQGIDFQITNRFEFINIPNFYYERNSIDNLLSNCRTINNVLKARGKDKDLKYILTIPISNDVIQDNELVEQILIILTDMKMIFDGYYITCDYKAGYKQKISIDYEYYTNLLRIFRTLKNQGFVTVYGYANWDSIIFSTLTDIDYISIGTYENLRKFTISRYTEDSSGGPSDGWYFSEKLLNFIKAQEITRFRNRDALQLIRNDNNAFSDIILEPSYIWNVHKPDVHKNYLLSISKLLKSITEIDDLEDRCRFTIEKIKNARRLYKQLYHDYNIRLHDENEDYHLSTWESFMEDNM